MTDSQLPLEDVLDLVMQEEPEPTHAALLRWTERYPDYLDALTDFFATWMMQEVYAETAPPVQYDEEKLTQRALEFARELAAKQGKTVPAGTYVELSSFDQMVMAAIWSQRGVGNAVNVTEWMTEKTGKFAPLGKILSSLDSLEERGLTQSRIVEGKKMKHYTVTMVGQKSLAHAKEASQTIADLLGDFA